MADLREYLTGSFYNFDTLPLQTETDRSDTVIILNSNRIEDDQRRFASLASGKLLAYPSADDSPAPTDDTSVTSLDMVVDLAGKILLDGDGDGNDGHSLASGSVSAPAVHAHYDAATQLQLQDMALQLLSNSDSINVSGWGFLERHAAPGFEPPPYSIRQIHYWCMPLECDRFVLARARWVATRQQWEATHGGAHYTSSRSRASSSPDSASVTSAGADTNTLSDDNMATDDAGTADACSFASLPAAMTADDDMPDDISITKLADDDEPASTAMAHVGDSAIDDGPCYQAECDSESLGERKGCLAFDSVFGEYMDPHLDAKDSVTRDDPIGGTVEFPSAGEDDDGGPDNDGEDDDIGEYHDDGGYCYDDGDFGEEYDSYDDNDYN